MHLCPTYINRAFSSFSDFFLDFPSSPPPFSFCNSRPRSPWRSFKLEPSKLSLIESEPTKNPHLYTLELSESSQEEGEELWGRFCYMSCIDLSCNTWGGFQGRIEGFWPEESRKEAETKMTLKKWTQGPVSQIDDRRTAWRIWSCEDDLLAWILGRRIICYSFKNIVRCSRVPQIQPIHLEIEHRFFVCV